MGQILKCSWCCFRAYRFGFLWFKYAVSESGYFIWIFWQTFKDTTAFKKSYIVAITFVIEKWLLVLLEQDKKGHRTSNTNLHKFLNRYEKSRLCVCEKETEKEPFSERSHLETLQHCKFCACIWTAGCQASWNASLVP